MKVASRASLLLRAALWILRVEYDRRRVPFGDLVDRLERVPIRGTRSVGAEDALAAVSRAYSLSPFRRTCLKESLAGVGLLRGLGYRARLVVGVKGATTPVDAHAWIEIDGKSLDCAVASYVPLRRARS